MKRERRCVCFGSSRTARGTSSDRLAQECGAELARLGWTVMSGGYEGSMGAVSRGAREAGGRVLGVTTPIFEARRANEALDAEFREPDYLARLATLLRQGHAFVGLPGGLGTLSECTVAWCLASIGHLAGPLVLFRDPWQPLFESISRLEEVPPELASLLHWIDSPADLARSPGPA